MDPVVEANDLVKHFGDLTAVDGISFGVEKGECFGILGPNGAGKTTTVRLIHGFSPLTAGSLRVFGLDIEADGRAIKARVGVCHQDNNLDPDLTVLENLEVFARYFDVPRDEARRRASRLLEFIALDHRRDSRVTQLSGGMMRRLVLARALINEPDLLILDEPTTGLDPQSRHQVWERLETLKARGLTILLTTHYMDEAARLCDRLIIVDHGRILVNGRPAELIRDHVGRDVIEVDDPLPELVELARSEGWEHEALSHRLIIYSAEGERVFQRIGEASCRGICSLRMATLEDVFLKLTGRDLRE
ncbi:MAG: ATP-binding cassette domain-containing protein [Deltaproteobacteria bacterium]|nr:ATP-binding cassette domain-containing protein [Deltaproteobacteria bacterium]